MHRKVEFYIHVVAIYMEIRSIFNRLVVGNCDMNRDLKAGEISDALSDDSESHNNSELYYRRAKMSRAE